MIGNDRRLLYSHLREQGNKVGMVVSPLWHEPDNIHGFVLDRKTQPTRIGYCSNTNNDRRFWCEDNNVALTDLQPHYYRVRQVEPCHQLG